MTVTIREAGLDDAAALVRLVAEMATEEGSSSPIDERYARRFLTTPENGALLALDAGEAVGLLSYSITPGLYHAADSGLIQLLVVTHGRRGEGIGSRLVEAALHVFEEAGCAEASVSTGADNAPAQRVYREAGLTESSLLLEKHFSD